MDTIHVTADADALAQPSGADDPGRPPRRGQTSLGGGPGAGAAIGRTDIGRRPAGHGHRRMGTGAAGTGRWHRCRAVRMRACASAARTSGKEWVTPKARRGMRPRRSSSIPTIRRPRRSWARRCSTLDGRPTRWPVWRKRWRRAAMKSTTGRPWPPRLKRRVKLTLRLQVLADGIALCPGACVRCATPPFCCAFVGGISLRR